MESFHKFDGMTSFPFCIRFILTRNQLINQINKLSPKLKSDDQLTVASFEPDTLLVNDMLPID